MKKIVFTLQVFALIAMFPLYFVVELNHATTKFPSENNTSGDNQVQVKNIPTASSNMNAELINQLLITGVIKSIY